MRPCLAFLLIAFFTIDSSLAALEDYSVSTDTRASFPVDRISSFDKDPIDSLSDSSIPGLETRNLRKRTLSEHYRLSDSAESEITLHSNCQRTLLDKLVVYRPRELTPEELKAFQDRNKMPRIEDEIQRPTEQIMSEERLTRLHCLRQAGFSVSECSRILALPKAKIQIIPDNAEGCPASEKQTQVEKARSILDRFKSYKKDRLNRIACFASSLKDAEISMIISVPLRLVRKYKTGKCAFREDVIDEARVMWKDMLLTGTFPVPEDVDHDLINALGAFFADNTVGSL